MPETMIERVAAALARKLEADGLVVFRGDKLSGEDLVENPHEVYVDGLVDLEDFARAAIAAMREPTGGMLSAGNDCGSPGDDGWEPADPYPTWQAMIDAVLEEKADG